MACVNSLNYSRSKFTPVYCIFDRKDQIPFSDPDSELIENLSEKSVSAMATFQVYPPELKDYMTKMNCFCYEKQTLKGGEKEKYALVLLVDPDVTKNIKEAIIQFVYFKK